MTEETLKPDKSWMNGKIRKLLADRHFALSQHQRNKMISIKPKLQCEIRRAKQRCAAKVEQSLKFDNLRRSWDQLTLILSLMKPNSRCHLPPDVLSKYYTRFEKDIPPSNISSHTGHSIYLQWQCDEGPEICQHP